MLVCMVCTCKCASMSVCVLVCGERVRWSVVCVIMSVCISERACDGSGGGGNGGVWKQCQNPFATPASAHNHSNAKGLSTVAWSCL